MSLSSEEINLITLVAKQYYFEGRTQNEISDSLNLSRTKISRMLKQSRELGLVSIRINLNPVELSDLGQELKRRFGIRHALIAVDHEDEELQRVAVAQLVADHLAEILSDGMVVAVGMGRNLGAVADLSYSARQRACTFVSAIGGTNRVGDRLNSDSICRKLASKLGGMSEMLYAPACVEDPHLRSLLLKNETVKQALTRARRADVALLGIGDCTENGYMANIGWYSPVEIARARLSGAVADVSGYDFLDIRGQRVALELGDRIIGLSHADYARIPNVIAVVSEQNKTLSLLASLRSGVIDTLATSAGNAHAILAIDDRQGAATASRGEKRGDEESFAAAPSGDVPSHG
jgi:DNA-binding transcriptional regulator LsrR (DeoR family)